MNLEKQITEMEDISVLELFTTNEEIDNIELYDSTV